MFFHEFPLPTEPRIPSRVFDARNFGNINRAIAHASENGGGKVIVPEGEWLSGQIHLKSNIELHFEKGARVIFSTTPEDYLPVVLTMYEGMRCYNYSPLIYGNGIQNVAITGEGILDGNGAKWWKWAKNMTARDILYSGTLPLEKRIFGTPEYGLRPMPL